MTSQSCQTDSESAHVPPKGPCHTVLCGPGSSLDGSSLGPPKKHGGQSKPVSTSSWWVAECQAGWLRLLLLLRFMPLAGGLQVKTAETTQTVFLHDNVTVLCQIPGLPRLNITTVGIVWFLMNKRIYEFYGNHLKVLRPGANVSLLGLERGDASLFLPRIKLSEAGEYQCKLVVTPEQAVGVTRINVVARPVGTLFVGPARERNGEWLTCKLDGFYPEAIDIKWERYIPKVSHFQAITEGIITGPTMRNDDGTFRVNSSVALNRALEDRLITYFCVVSHKSLLVPKKFNVTLSEKGSVEIYVTIVGPCVLLILVTIVYSLWRCCDTGAT